MRKYLSYKSISDMKFSNLRNTFFDLYAADVKLLKRSAVEDDNEMFYTVHIEDANKKLKLVLKSLIGAI